MGLLFYYNEISIEIAVAASELSASERISSSHNHSRRWAVGAERLGMNDVPKELLHSINMGDPPESLSDNTSGLGNMPELTLLLEDDEVVRKFSVSLVIIN